MVCIFIYLFIFMLIFSALKLEVLSLDVRCVFDLYLAIHTEYIDDNSVYSEILAVHMAVHPGGASRRCSRYNLNLTFPVLPLAMDVVEVHIYFS